MTLPGRRPPRLSACFLIILFFGGAYRLAVAERAPQDETAEDREFRRALGLEKGFSQRELRSAYRRKAQETHPDKCSQEDAEKCHQRFVLLAEAYEALRSDRPRFVRGGRRSRRPPGPAASAEAAAKYEAMNQARREEMERVRRRREKELAETLERTQKKMEEAVVEADKKKAAEHAVKQAEHDVWVQQQNDQWKAFEARQEKKRQRAQRELERQARLQAPADEQPTSSKGHAQEPQLTQELAKLRGDGSVATSTSSSASSQSVEEVRVGTQSTAPGDSPPPSLLPSAASVKRRLRREERMRKRRRRRAQRQKRDSFSVSDALRTWRAFNKESHHVDAGGDDEL